MRKRQRISFDFNVRKPKLQINHSISKNVNKKNDDIKEIVNNPYLAHTLESTSSSSSLSPPPPPSPPPLPPPPPVINDNSSSLNYLLNYEDSSSESESEDNTQSNITEKEKEKEMEMEKENKKEISINDNNNNTDLMNSFETFLSEINELESKSNTTISQISTNAANSSISNNEPSLSKEKDNTLPKNENILTKENTTKELSYHDSSVIIINKLAYLASDKSIIYTTTPTQDYLYHQIEFSTRYKDWSVGALNSEYFINYHNEINNLLTQIEGNA
ncbi:hypothetical protein PIROE2DRAFT_2078 [Piromyces sp. E2]|nr:hypothetical protein PIROE2DRAFT_2078 [Piromyces sp. E2]|eukprot:OUM69887.1 hypothetical protein PIROE2DRAFT_2078 [Piromyces sp. E2]